MTLVTGFDDLTLGRSGDIRTLFPLSDEDVERTIVAGGRTGVGQALSIETEGLSSNVIRRGTQGEGVGRAEYVRVGFGIKLAQPAVSLNFTNPATPTFPSQGLVLFDLRVSAEIRRQAGYDYDTNSTCGAVAAASREQFTGVLADEPYRFPSVVVGVGTDGYLRVSQGRFLASSATSLFVGRTTKPMPFGVWTFLEFEFGFGADGDGDGFCYAYIDGEQVAALTGTSFAADGLFDNINGRNIFDYLLSSPVLVDGQCLPFGADTLGWYDFGLYAEAPSGTGSAIDDFFLVGLDRYPADAGTPWGPVVGGRLVPDADGALSQSTIGGTTPAPSRWQSLLSNDADVTRTEYAPGQADTFSMEPVVALGIKSVIATATVKKSDARAASVEVTVDDGTTEASAATTALSASEYGTVSLALDEKPSGGGWSAADVNASEFGVRRGT